MADFQFVPPHPLDDEAPGGVVINPHSALGRELRRWEQHYSDLTPRGTQPGNPYVYRDYPKMLYKAGKRPNGQAASQLAMPDPYQFDKPELLQQAILAVETWNTAHQRIVFNESEERIAEGQGWTHSAMDALTAFEAEQQAIATAAAETAFHAQRMSEQARAELKEANESTDAHVVDVKSAKKRSHKKAVPVTAEG